LSGGNNTNDLIKAKGLYEIGVTLRNIHLVMGGIFAFVLLGNNTVLAWLRAGFALDNDLTIYGLGAEVVISILVSALAVFLFVISAMAYRKSGKRRLLFVTAAFFVFVVKGFLIALNDLPSIEVQWIESAASLFDFAILLLFFSGLVKE
jgi:hypothetical protein